MLGSKVLRFPCKLRDFRPRIIRKFFTAIHSSVQSYHHVSHVLPTSPLYFNFQFLNMEQNIDSSSKMQESQDGTFISEGQAKVFFPGVKDVFYNPVQEFNRDLR